MNGLLRVFLAEGIQQDESEGADRLNRRNPERESPYKLRGGPPASGVEGHPETGCPLDPGPGLGGNSSVGLFWAIASPFLCEFPVS
jgi:hypothetical protein